MSENEWEHSFHKDSLGQGHHQYRLSPDMDFHITVSPPPFQQRGKDIGMGVSIKKGTRVEFTVYLPEFPKGGRLRDVNNTLGWAFRRLTSGMSLLLCKEVPIAEGIKRTDECTHPKEDCVELVQLDEGSPGQTWVVCNGCNKVVGGFE